MKEALMNIFFGLEAVQKAFRNLITDWLPIRIDEHSWLVIIYISLFVGEREPPPCGKEFKYCDVRNV